MTLVLGVDGCRGGWCVVSVDTNVTNHSIVSAEVFDSFDAILKSPAEIVCVDIPIGLLDAPGQRACDVEARRLLGRPRASSVFPPPCRTILSLGLSGDNYRHVSSENERRTGKRLTKQSFAIAPKIKEVDDLLIGGHESRVREVHPELCFWALAGSSMKSRKSKREGHVERWGQLRKVFLLESHPNLPQNLASRCALDDYVDALVAAWTAVCISRGTARRIPAPPQMDLRGLPMEMWLPRD